MQGPWFVAQNHQSREEKRNGEEARGRRGKKGESARGGHGEGKGENIEHEIQQCNLRKKMIKDKVQVFIDLRTDTRLSDTDIMWSLS